MEFTLFVTCSQGLEALLQEELEQFGFTSIRKGYRGVYVDASDARAIYRINYCSRLAGRVLFPLAQFRCSDSKALYRGSSEVEWKRFIPKGKTIAIDANVQHPELRNSLFAAQVVKDAICDQLREVRGERPVINTSAPDVQLNLFIHRFQAFLSFDTSGAPLHKRGYRVESVEAPLQETLAAAMLKVARYQSEEILLDPCCGSGTFLIEAALMATKTPPGFLRQTWGFRYLPFFSNEQWLEVKNAADDAKVPLPRGRLFGLDINKNAARITRSNLRAAGLQDLIEVDSCDFRDFQCSVLPTLIICNPPHGNRLGEEEMLIPLYRALGDFLKKNSARPGRGFVYTGNLELAKQVGLAAKKRYVFESGGVEGRLLEFDLY